MKTMLDKCAVAGDITQAIDRRGAWSCAITVIGGAENTAVKLQSADSAGGEFTDFKTLISADEAETDQYKGFVLDLSGAGNFIKIVGATMATCVLGDCDHDVKTVAIKAGEIPSGADLENNKTATINVSTYTEPVEITPTAGKDGMKKVTVTLTNIPDPSSIPDFFIWKTGAGSYVLLPFDDATEIADLAAFEAQKIGYMNGAAEFTYGDVPDYAGFDDLSSFTADSATQFTVENDGNEAVYTLCGATTVICDLDTNVAHTIDVSTYTQPVTIQPSEGKNAMIGAIVTLENIPAGGSGTAYAWTPTSGSRMYTSFAEAPESSELVASEKTLSFSVGGGQVTDVDVIPLTLPEGVTYARISDSSFSITSNGSTMVYNRTAKKDFTLW